MALDRFKNAQAARRGGFETALAELQAGRKTSHWIWYIFPQLAGLGRSSMAEAYAITDLNEACEYLRDELLRARLMTLTAAVENQLNRGVGVAELMGGKIDSLKLVSSLTLFQIAARQVDAAGSNPALANFAAMCDRVLAIAEREGFPRCAHTLAQCHAG